MQNFARDKRSSLFCFQVSNKKQFLKVSLGFIEQVLDEDEDVYYYVWSFSF